MTQENDPRFPEAADPDIPVDGTVELNFEDSEVDLQALADEVAEQEIQAAQRSAKRVELESAMQEAHRRVEELERLDKEQRDKHHRLLADFNNYRNRTAREIQMAVDLAEKKLLMEILPVLDSFERCLDATYQDLEGFQGGVVLIHKQFQDALRRLGVEPVAMQVGDPFDAQHSEALTTMQNAQLPDGCVGAIFEKGYLLRSGLLRAARVVVNHNEQEVTETPVEPSEGDATEVNHGR